MTRSDFLEAVTDFQLDKVQAYLESDWDVNEQDENGWTALHFAAQNNSVPIGKLLIEAGADIEAKDSYGNTPLFRATFASHGDCRFIKLLLINGADPNASNHHNVSPLMLARKIGNYPVANCFDKT